LETRIAVLNKKWVLKIYFTVNGFI
jgi:hypothetical protein